MEIWQAIVVGVVQGLAEFLPISSSGHIVLTQFLLGMRPFAEGEAGDIVFEVILHLGTLMSVLVYFRKRLWNMTKSVWTKDLEEDRRWIWLLGLATLPAVVLVVTPIKFSANAETGEREKVTLGDVFESAYDNPVVVSSLLLVTGALLLAPRFIKTKNRKLGWGGAIAMGIGQAIAILPGISRSGSSITAGLISGVDPKKAAEFSFLMSIPAIAGAVVFKLDEFKEKFTSETMVPYLAGAVSSFVVGILAVALVMTAIKRGKFQYFAYYCFAAGISGIIYFSMTA